MSRHYALRDLDALRRSLEARDCERDSALVLLLSRLSSMLVSQQALLDRIADEHAAILAALAPPPAAVADLPPVEAAGIVVLSEIELRSVIDLAA